MCVSDGILLVRRVERDGREKHVSGGDDGSDDGDDSGDGEKKGDEIVYSATRRILLHVHVLCVTCMYSSASSTKDDNDVRRDGRSETSGGS